MKPGGVSSLNPYAVSYIPLSKREADGRTSVAESKDHDGRTVWFQTSQHITEDQHLLDPITHAAKKVSVPESYQVEGKPASSSYSSSSRNLTELLPDDDPDVDIEYLKMTFPSVSVQSLRDVYMVNGDDLDAAIDMLNQLESDGVESSGSLPETLDIGDVSESGLAADSAALKLKNVAAEASNSSNPLTSANVSSIKL